MIKHILTASLFFVSLSLSAQNKTTQQTQSSPEWKTIKDALYQFQYPSNWHLDQSGSMQTGFVLFGREFTEGTFRENINLMIQDLTGYNLDLAAYARLSEEQVRSNVVNGKILESRPVTVDGVTHHLIVYEGDFNQFKLRWKQYYRIKDNKAYILTFTATQETYNDFLPTADRIMNSFALTK